MPKGLVFELINEPIRPAADYQCIGQVRTGRNKSRRCGRFAWRWLTLDELPWRCHQHKLSSRA